jgi:hypothetical protein
MSEGKQQTFVEIPAGSEWRFELEADEDIAVRVSLLSQNGIYMGVAD